MLIDEQEMAVCTKMPEALVTASTVC